MKKFLPFFSCVILIFFCFCPQPEAFAQETNGFLLTNENDTLSIERYIRRTHQIKGRSLIKKQLPITYEAKLIDSGRIEELIIRVLKPNAPEGTVASQEAILWIKGDTIITASKKGEEIKRDTLKTTAGAMFYHPNLPILPLLEQIVIRAKAIGGKEVSLPVFLLSTQGQTTTAKLNFPTQDSVRIKLGNIEVKLETASDGTIKSGKTNSGQIIKRVESVPDSALSTKSPDYSAPADAPYTAEEVTIKTKAGHSLAGTLTLPQNTSEAVPVVVTITGSSPQDRDNNTPFGGPYQIFRTLADTLGRQGIAVLRMDDRGVGGSTGNLESATTKERADDIIEGINFLRTREDIDQSKIILVGLSEGAVIAPMLASSRDSLNGIVLLAGPAGTGRETMKYQLEESIKTVDSLSQDERKDLLNKKIKEIEQEAKNDPWLKFFLDYDPVKTAREVNDVPVLILQGKTDKNVPPGDAEKLEAAFKAAGNEDVTLKYFEGVNHVFVKDENGHPQNYGNLTSFEVAPEVIATIVEWIAAHTKK